MKKNKFLYFSKETGFLGARPFTNPTESERMELSKTGVLVPYSKLNTSPEYLKYHNGKVVKADEEECCISVENKNESYRQMLKPIEKTIQKKTETLPIIALILSIFSLGFSAYLFSRFLYIN